MTQRERYALILAKLDLLHATATQIRDLAEDDTALSSMNFLDGDEVPRKMAVVLTQIDKARDKVITAAYDAGLLGGL